jgi:hypothetical protein
MHPIQDLFLEGFSYVLQFDMHFYMHSYLDKKNYSCKKWVLQARDAATVVEATHIALTLTTETSAYEAIAAWDSAALHVKDVEGQAALAGRVSRAEAENVTALTSAHEDADGFA